MAATRNLVVIGTSAGGVPALQLVVAALPPNLNAAVCIVMHIPTHTPTHLDKILQRVTDLPVTQASHGQELVSGAIVVSRTDYHFLIEGTRVRLTHEPREHWMRPSIDGLFRTAAKSYGPRTIGAVLTGMLDDGTAGLRAIKEGGGTTIVQSPAEAEYDSMPKNALRYVPIDYTLQLHEVAAVLTRLVNQPLSSQGKLFSELAIADPR